MSETGAGDAARQGKWFVRLQQARFTQLLIAVSLLLVVAPLAGVFQHQLGRTFAACLIVVVWAGVLIVAALAVSEHNRQSRVAIGLALACILLSVPAHLMDSPALRITQDVLAILLFAHIVRLLIRALFRQRTVDHDTIAASLCGYLLIGVGFAVVYSLVIEINADAIRIPPSSDTQRETMRFGDHTTGTTLYFSFVTLTTLGYGDIVPVSMPAQLLTTAEALIGQFYLVVLVARLVGLHITNQMRDHRDE